STLLLDQDSPRPSGGTWTARDPIHHLRLFANYLTPRRGALSADTWRAVTFYVRSLVFNWLALLPILLVVVMLAQLYFVAWNEDVALGFACSTPGGDEETYQVLWTLCEGHGPAHGEVVRARVVHAAAPLVILVAAMAAVSILWRLPGTSPPWPALCGLVALLRCAGYIAAGITGVRTGSYQAAAAGRGQASAEPQSRTTRMVFLVAPYVVLGVLALLLAYAGRKIIVVVAGEPDVAQALSYGVIAGAVVQLVFAVSELRRRRLPGVNFRAWSLVALAIVSSGSQAMFFSRMDDA